MFREEIVVSEGCFHINVVCKSDLMWTNVLVSVWAEWSDNGLSGFI